MILAITGKSSTTSCLLGIIEMSAFPFRIGKHSVQFTSQLLHMSLDYVNGLIQDAVNYMDRDLGSESDRERIQHILTYLTAKTMELRSFQYGIPAFGSECKEKQDKEEIQDAIFKKWSEMDDKVQS